MVIRKAAKKILEKTKSVRTRRRPAIKMLERNEIENIIREQAYKIYEQRGYSHGNDMDDWLQAERMVTKV